MPKELKPFLVEGCVMLANSREEAIAEYNHYMNDIAQETLILAFLKDEETIDFDEEFLPY